MFYIQVEPQVHAAQARWTHPLRAGDRIFKIAISEPCKREPSLCSSVLRIRDVYRGSRIRIFSIPDPG